MSAPVPHSSEAEAGALACVLNANGTAGHLLDQLEEEDFHDVRHLPIFRALVSLQFEGRPLDVPTLTQWLRDQCELEEAGGLQYVSALPDQTPSPENFPSFLETVKDRTRRRQMLREADQTRTRALDTSRPIDDKPKSNLPTVEDAAAFAAAVMPEPPQLVRGILHKGCKFALGGGSKTFKSWTLIDLALAVAHGEPWLSFGTTRARVCYVNLELPPWSLHSRIKAVARDKHIDIAPGWLQVWNLRGHATAYSELLPVLAGELNTKDLGLIIIDPIYRLYGTADENSARDIANLLNQFEHLAQQTGAATAFAAHFSKGNQAGKEAVDRISGSGVFARDPDAILTFTRHEEEGAFVVDSTLRNCKAVEPFAVRWNYPLMRRDDELDPTKLKQAKGRPSPYKAEQLLQALTTKGLTTTNWQEAVCSETGMSRAKFYDLKASLESIKAVEKDTKGRWKRQCSQRPESPETHL